jgi:ABC-2 type transport system ATP-binding protein
MDEAERCHQIAYIAYGQVLAHGTADEVVAAAGLTTWTVHGQNLHAVQERLLATRGVDMVAPFGTSLHVSGRDAAALQTAIASFGHGSGLAFEPSEPTLEDVFIDMMGRARDNFK